MVSLSRDGPVRERFSTAAQNILTAPKQAGPIPENGRHRRNRPMMGRKRKQPKLHRALSRKPKTLPRAEGKSDQTNNQGRPNRRPFFFNRIRLYTGWCSYTYLPGAAHMLICRVPPICLFAGCRPYAYLPGAAHTLSEAFPGRTCLWAIS